MILRSISRSWTGGIPRFARQELKHKRYVASSSLIPPPSHPAAARRRRRHEHSTSAASQVTEDEDYYDDEEDHPSAVKVEHTSTTKPRLQALREKLKREPAPQSFLANTTNTNGNSQANAPAPKTIHWKELLKRSQEAPPLNGTVVNGQKHLYQQEEAAEQPAVLTDRFGRHHNYLRISLAERCNLRCTYCMPPEGVPLQPQSQLLQTPEILSLAQHFKNHGVNKIRLTGGEPTLRKDLVEILQGLSAIGGFEELAITTNAVTLTKNLDAYMEAGLNRVNISLDTLHPDKFATLTRRPAAYWDKVWQAIELATTKSPLELVTKINVVVMKGINDTEVADFCALQQQFPNLHVRFIEYMPFTENGWNMDKWVPYRDLLAQLDQQDNVQLVSLPEVDPNDTTKWYTTAENHQRLQQQQDGAGIGRIGFITSMSQPFCGTCNRLRLTSDGQIKVCLFDGNSTISLRDALREGANAQDLDRLIQHALRKKHFQLGGHTSPEHILQDSDSNRPMTLIGG